MCIDKKVEGHREKDSLCSFFVFSYKKKKKSISKIKGR